MCVSFPTGLLNLYCGRNLVLLGRSHVHAASMYDGKAQSHPSLTMDDTHPSQGFFSEGIKPLYQLLMLRSGKLGIFAPVKKVADISDVFIFACPVTGCVPSEKRKKKKKSNLLQECQVCIALCPIPNNHIESIGNIYNSECANSRTLWLACSTASYPFCLPSKAPSFK